MAKVNPLSKTELARLAQVLEHFELDTCYTTGLKRLSGGFARAEMFDYDDEQVDIELRWGIQNDCENNVTTEQYRLPRTALAGRAWDKDKAYASISD